MSRAAARAAAAVTQREATVVGWVDGVPVAREVLDTRLAALRAGPRAAALPAPGSSEDRQFVRWTAQVLLTEELCRRHADRLGLDVSAPAPLDPVVAAQLGSINTAAWQACPAVGALFDHLVPDPDAPEPGPGSLPARDTGHGPELGPVRAGDTGHGTELGPARARDTGQGPAGPAPRWWRVSHAVADDPDRAATAPLTSIGWTTLDDLPAALAARLRRAAPGERVGPVRSPLGYHVARIEHTTEPPEPPRPERSEPPRPERSEPPRPERSEPPRAACPEPPRPELGQRLREYARWLDHQRATSIRTAPGFEHPGDPSQPDNTHRH